MERERWGRCGGGRSVHRELTPASRLKRCAQKHTKKSIKGARAGGVNRQPRTRRAQNTQIVRDRDRFGAGIAERGALER